MFPENRLLEILIIGAVALIVVGPKDLPILMRRVGQWIGRMRSMAADFRASFDELARQSELDELKKEVEAMRNDPRHYANWNPTQPSAAQDAGSSPPEASALPTLEPAPPAEPTESAPATEAAAARRPRAKKQAGETT